MASSTNRLAGGLVVIALLIAATNAISMGQAITTTQFYIYGRSHFTATGWAKAAKTYVKGEIEEADLAGRVYCVTGANSGIGKETATFLASRGAKVWMLCRSRDRAEKARTEMTAKMNELSSSASKTTTPGSLELLIADVSLAADTVRAAEELIAKESRLDGLICNAGALQNSKTMTKEGVEVTFASHLAFGSHLLAKRLEPLLRKAPDPRVVFVTSGGMYNAKFPTVSACVDPPEASYDGQFAYVHAKRGQVLLAEHLAAQETKAAKTPPICFVSSHPGWTDTPAVDTAYGDQKKYLEPMRSMWQGAEGMVWLAIVPTNKLEPGALYLDRRPQRKHLAGPFFTDGSRTKNTPAEVAQMVRDLDALCESKMVPSSSS